MKESKQLIANAVSYWEILKLTHSDASSKSKEEEQCFQCCQTAFNHLSQYAELLMTNCNRLSASIRNRKE